MKYISYTKYDIKNIIQCFICNKVLLLLTIDIRHEYNTENFIQYKGEIRCVDC